MPFFFATCYASIIAHRWCIHQNKWKNLLTLTFHRLTNYHHLLKLIENDPPSSHFHEICERLQRLQKEGEEKNCYSIYLAWVCWKFFVENSWKLKNILHLHLWRALKGSWGNTLWFYMLYISQNMKRFTPEKTLDLLRELSD